MKITSLQENLKNGLYYVAHIAGKNVNLPILNNVLVKTSGGKIQLITTDLELGVITTIRGKVEKDGEFTVDSKIFSEYIGLLPNKKVEIELKDLSFDIKCENYKTNIKGMSAEDYPLIPSVEKEVFYKIEAEVLKQALQQVIFSVSNSETRLELTGVFFDLDKDKIVLVATDSFRLAEKTIQVKSNSEKKNGIIVPAKTLQEIIRILSAMKNTELDDQKKEVTFYVTENQILFEVDGIELVSRLIEGQYPDYKQIIPEKAETTCVVEKGELLRAVKASAIFSKTGINDINLDFPEGKNKLIISSTSSQVGENTSELEASVKGSDNGVVINYRYLLDGINNIPSSNLKIDVVNSSTPCTLRGEKDDDYFYIIMPIKQ